ncbi:MAG: monofunctional biosynthetic peptidoglycan transglycosylase [Azospira oryzae]|uniref:Biosynthetic peptidoglycan transglycosylase n=1 Tax=Pelomicrobium methylotrophicum TaxID=2602750 RepID=A0A5C7EK34_9PROT|nr:monofunctional biosynthetic peptidoglycan transglycosylase [Pelomicrobium methylotrophicum]PZP63981.1 MAG: monofunctional biosynthetic peptidoglycan transglycosylase [Azospira oryzae]PZP82272.1 MAG: monofunctional biosynthetic peptidoglycan transglycosylase [Azospira oryzae]TXF12888.1 monofunctional biosynthetic peptidoglycan transglycosylase [Pelomicrobium methylotrophicum]
MKRLRRLFLRLLLLLALLFLGYQLWIFAQIVYWSRFDPASTAFMERRLAELRAKNPRAELKHQWVPYGRISAHLKRAIVAAEDARFLEHEGFDFEAIQKAYEKNLKKGRIVAGASTISQQLAKNLFLSPERTPWRKAQEALITVMLEAVMSKRRILEIYLNVIEWGNGVFGAEAASRHYFGVSAAGLSEWQAARLAAMVPNPRFYDRHRDTPWLDRKTEIILSRMPAAQIP